jgi:hypothetical protein
MIHQLPYNDAIVHELQDTCECNPDYYQLVSGEVILSHYALDGREQCLEVGIIHSKIWDYEHVEDGIDEEDFDDDECEG